MAYVQVGQTTDVSATAAEWLLGVRLGGLLAGHAAMGDPAGVYSHP